MLLNKSAVAAGVFSVLCWSSLPVIMKLGLESLPITYFLLLRFATASVFCLAITRFEVSQFAQISLSRWLLLSAILTTNFILQAIAIHEIPATWYIAVFSLSPLISLLCLRSKINSISAIGIGLAILGTLIFALSSDQLNFLSWSGILALFGGMITWALYVPLVQPFQNIFDDRQVTAITSFLSLIPISLLWLIQGAPMHVLSAQGILAIGILGIIVPLAYWTFLYSIRHIPVFGISSQYLEPIFGFALAVLVLGESFHFLQALGGLIILSALSIIRPA